MKLSQILATIVISTTIISCGTKRVPDFKIPAKLVEAGTCVFGAKTSQHATITTRSDCVLRGGAFAPDVNELKNESDAELL